MIRIRAICSGRPQVAATPYVPHPRSESAVSSTLGVGVDVGIANGWQLGVNTEFLVTPQSTLGVGTFEGNVQRRVTRWLSVHADLGLQLTQRAYWTLDDGDEASFDFSMVAGVALPLKLKLARKSGAALAKAATSPAPRCR